LDIDGAVDRTKWTSGFAAVRSRRGDHLCARVPGCTDQRTRRLHRLPPLPHRRRRDWDLSERGTARRGKMMAILAERRCDGRRCPPRSARGT